MAKSTEALERLASTELPELLRVLQGSDVRELELEVGGTRLLIRRSNTVAATSVSLEPPPASLPQRETVFVVAERVGFFHYPAEGQGGLLQAGEVVAEGQLLGIIDSLSVPIQVSAPRAGLIDEMLVEEGQPVEYGQPLFVIQPSGS